MNFRDSIEQATRASICAVLAGTEAAAWVGNALTPPWVDNPVPETVRKARLAACSNPDAVVDVPLPPFFGGQCEGVEYDVTVVRNSYTRRRCSNGSTSTIALNSSITVRVYGPIGGLQTQETSQGDCGASSVRVVLNAFDSSGNPDSLIVYSATENPLSFAIDAVDVEISSVIRIDGQPDDCGNPPAPAPPPYSPITINQDFSYTDNSQTTVNEQGDFTVWAPIIIGGNLIAPVTVDVGGLTINGELNLETGDFNFNFGIPSGGPDYEDIPVENPNPEDEGPDDNPDIFYGLQVFSFESGSSPLVTSSWHQETAPTLHLPRTANVWFIVPVGPGWGWVGPIPCQHGNQVVMVPGGLPAIDHRVIPNTGWEVEVNRLTKPDCGCRSALG